MGGGAAASGANSTAVGRFSASSSPQATAVGFTATAGGQRSTAVGGNATTSANDATAVGSAAVAGFVGSTAIGAGATTTAANQVTIGGTGSSVRIGDIAVSDPNFGTRYRARYARSDGQLVPLVVRRSGEERTLMLPVRNRLRTEEEIMFDRNASPKALKIRAGILRGQAN